MKTNILKILSMLIFALMLMPLHAQDTTDNVIMIIDDEAETVFDWTTDRCADEDIPDLPARAFRSADGKVQLIATHYEARRYVGESLDSVRHRCEVIAYSVGSADPSLFSDKEWLASIYTEDGTTIYSLQHNEYQGNTHTGQCPSGEYFACWYNSLTLAVSTDNGASFNNAATPPEHLVGASPYPYEAGAGPYGIFEPSNIVRGPDEYLYALIRLDEYQTDKQRVCLIRTDNIADPTSWRAWDGEGFTLSLPRPYTNPSENPQQQYCSSVALDEIGIMNQSLTFNTYVNQYLLLGTTADTINGREVWGIYYAFSDDLLNWSRRKLLLEVELPWTYEAGDADPILYASLLDPDSDSMFFDTSDQDAYIYFTQFNYINNQMTLDRDLVRIPVHLDMLQQVPPEYELTLSGQVPDGATGALLGYRVNTECDCAGTAEFSLYSMRYQQAGADENRVPNNMFTDGLANWNATGNYDFVASDLSQGMMLQVNVEESQSATLTGAVFPVDSETDFTATFNVRVDALTANAGYFMVVFVNDNGEIHRDTLTITPNITP